MAQIGQYASILGQLGGFLHTQGAREIEITDQGGFFAVSWQAADGARVQRCISEADLAHLERAPQPGTPAARDLAVLLTTLGREIDQGQIEVSRIAQDTDGFLVTGVSQGRYLNERYSYGELGYRGGLGQAARLHSPAPTAAPVVSRSPVPDRPVPVPSGGPDGLPSSPLRRRLQLQ